MQPARSASIHDPEPLHIFLHVQKCAGSTLRNMFEFNFRPSSRLALYNYETRESVDADLVRMGSERRAKVKVIYGHMAYWGMHEQFDRPAHYYTMLRNPVDRFVSHYVFGQTKRSAGDKRLWRLLDDQDRPRQPQDWLDKTPCIANFQTWFMATRLLMAGTSFRDFDLAPTEEHLSRVLSTLKQFRLVGVPGSNDDLYRIAYLTGVRFFTPNSNRKRKLDLGCDFRAKADSMLQQRGPLDARLWQTVTGWQSEPDLDRELTTAGQDFRGALALSKPTWPAFRMAQSLRRLGHSSKMD